MAPEVKIPNKYFIYLAYVLCLYIINDGQDVLVLMDVQGMKFEGLHVRTGALLAVIDWALVDSHEGARSQPQLVIVLEWGIVQEWIAAVCKGITPHASSALTPLATTLHI